jgi:hypothetical protein
MEDQPNPPIQGAKASPQAKSWREYQLKARQETPARIEDAAKYLAGMISISLSVILDFNAEMLKSAAKSPLLGAALIIWLLSLLCSFIVLFPTPYRYVGDSAESIERMHGRVIRYKYAWLITGALLFLAALCIVTAVYLRG